MLATCFSNPAKPCEIRGWDKVERGFALEFRSVEPMIRTAIE